MIDVEALIVAENGNILDVKELPCIWGEGESYPFFLKCRVNNVPDIETAKQFMIQKVDENFKIIGDRKYRINDNAIQILKDKNGYSIIEYSNYSQFVVEN